MDIQTTKEPNATLITIAGRMDAVSAPQYDATINELVAGGETSFVVDFKALDYISSAGLRSLLASAKLLKSKGGQLCFANITGTVKEVFDISGFGSIFQIHESVTSALASIG
jgi:stage II sporulation protein AA (anti-sigma F factor antagonist)